MEISYTQVRVYLECPYKYKLQFVDRRRVLLDPPSSLGLSLHRALECFHRSEGGTLDELLECYEKGWISKGYPDDETRERWRAKGRRILEKYIGQEESRRTEVVGVEREFSWPLGGHFVRGMIDRVDALPDGGHEIIDYKTYLEVASVAEVGDDLQMRYYGLGAKETWAYDPKLLTVDYVAAGKRVSVPYDDSREEELKALITRVADAVSAGEFKPDLSFCPKCPFRKDCPYSVAKD